MTEIYAGPAENPLDRMSDDELKEHLFSIIRSKQKLSAAITALSSYVYNDLQFERFSDPDVERFEAVLHRMNIMLKGYEFEVSAVHKRVDDEVLHSWADEFYGRKKGGNS